MPHSFGKRARTRKLFGRAYEDRGRRSLTTYKHIYKLGDYVDIVCNSSQQKGMPYKFYHGKTGCVWNVSKRAVGVLVNKVVGNRQIEKKIHVRVEHVRPSRCREDTLKRAREVSRRAAAGENTKMPKRMPHGPQGGHLVVIENPNTDIIDVEPLTYSLPY